MRKFGLLGKNISYSFSKSYFNDKFRNLGINAGYENFDLASISELEQVLQENPHLEGLNVTIPYKEDIFPYLSAIDPIAQRIGAVNVIKISNNNYLKGYNTDWYGFLEAIKPFLKPQHKKALILGTGGASKAVAYGLRVMEITPSFVSRSENADLMYAQLNQTRLQEFTVIVNCTPLGTTPKTSLCPDIPFQHLDERHLVFDLIYNPAETKLMRLASEKGATVSNGLKMLELQAEKAWDIWSEK